MLRLSSGRIGYAGTCCKHSDHATSNIWFPRTKPGRSYVQAALDGQYCRKAKAILTPVSDTTTTKKVIGISHSLFEEKLEQMKQAKLVKLDTELPSSDLKELVKQYKKVYIENKGEEFPSGPKKLLQLAVKAVFDSWNSPRAIMYRSFNQITGLKGTAVNIQCMVFGNMGSTSGTGVLFIRNPSTCKKKLYGEFLINAQLMIGFGQGEDVVAGIRTPEDLDVMKRCMPGAYKELVENCEILELHYKVILRYYWTA